MGANVHIPYTYLRSVDSQPLKTLAFRHFPLRETLNHVIPLPGLYSHQTLFSSPL